MVEHTSDGGVGGSQVVAIDDAKFITTDWLVDTGADDPARSDPNCDTTLAQTQEPLQLAISTCLVRWDQGHWTIPPGLEPYALWQQAPTARGCATEAMEGSLDAKMATRHKTLLRKLSML